jgi:hypothetical protein
MKTIRKTSVLIFSLLLLQSSTSIAGNDSNEYLGRWALHFEEGMGWLEVKQEEGYLDADLLWRGGSVTPVANVFIANGKLVVTRISTAIFEKANDEMRKHTITATLVLEGKGDQLIGKMTSPKKDGSGADIIYVHANRIPPVPAAPNLDNIKYGEPISLLGNDMSGWRLLEPHSVNGWKVEKGILNNDPVQKKGEPHIHYGNLRTDAEFEDFNLQLSVNVPEGSNSGVYLRGIYEVQVVDSYGKKVDSHNMGALYSRITPTEAAEKKAGQWQKMDITLSDRHLTVILNGKKIVDNQPVFGATGGAITSNEFVPGPIYLQGDHGKVSYKDIVLTPIIH